MFLFVCFLFFLGCFLLNLFLVFVVVVMGLEGGECVSGGKTKNPLGFIPLQKPNVSASLQRMTKSFKNFSHLFGKQRRLFSSSQIPHLIINHYDSHSY